MKIKFQANLLYMQEIIYFCELLFMPLTTTHIIHINNITAINYQIYGISSFLSSDALASVGFRLTGQDWPHWPGLASLASAGLTG